MVVSEMDCYFKGFNSCTEEEAWCFYDHANQLRSYFTVDWHDHISYVSFRSYFTSSHKIYDTLVVVE